MKQLLKDGGVYILRFDRDDEVLSGITSFAEARNVEAGTFLGIGAASRVVISYYDLETKQYLDVALEEVEIASLTGNIGTLNGKRVVHAHGVFSGRDCVAKSGHVKEVVVSGTCEARFEALSGKLQRMHDAETGLNLLT